MDFISFHFDWWEIPSGQCGAVYFVLNRLSDKILFLFSFAMGCETWCSKKTTIWIDSSKVSTDGVWSYSWHITCNEKTWKSVIELRSRTGQMKKSSRNRKNIHWNLLLFIIIICRLIRSLIISSSLKLKIDRSMHQIIEYRNTNLGLRIAKRREMISRYYRLLESHPLGDIYWILFFIVFALKLNRFSFQKSPLIRFGF